MTRVEYGRTLEVDDRGEIRRLVTRQVAARAPPRPRERAAERSANARTRGPGSARGFDAEPPQRRAPSLGGPTALERRLEIVKEAVRIVVDRVVIVDRQVVVGADSGEDLGLERFWIRPLRRLVGPEAADHHAVDFVRRIEDREIEDRHARARV